MSHTPSPKQFPITSIDPAVLTDALERGGTLLVGPREENLTAADIEAAFKWAFPRATEFPTSAFMGQTALAVHFVSFFGKRGTLNHRLPIWKLADFIAQAFGIGEDGMPEEAVVAALKRRVFRVERVRVGSGRYSWIANIRHVGSLRPKSEVFYRTMPILDIANFGALPPIKVWWPK